MPPRVQIVCDYCGRNFKSTSGRTYHQEKACVQAKASKTRSIKCPTQNASDSMSNTARGLNHEKVDLTRTFQSNSAATPRSRLSHELPKADAKSTSSSSAKQGLQGKPSYDAKLATTINISDNISVNEGTDYSSFSFDVDHNINPEKSNTPIIAASSINTSTSRSSASGRRSDSVVTDTRSFHQATGKRAGVSYTDNTDAASFIASITSASQGPTSQASASRASRLRSLPKPEPLSDVEEEFLSWVIHSNLSKGDIDRYLKLPLHKKILSQSGLWTINSYATLLNRAQHDFSSAGFDMRWKTTPLNYSEPKLRLTIEHIDVIDVVRFLIGHKPFVDDLVYAPRQEFNSTGSRIYTQAHTANHWWSLQDSPTIPDGATIIPIQWTSDKTLLTDHKGDRKAHACYLSILNLSREARRRQDRPGTLPIALMPILAKSDNDTGVPYSQEFKRQVFHDTMRVVFKSIESLPKDGIPMTCADGRIRQCFPILACVMADYEEQVTLTGIKSLKHCPKCLVSKDEMNDLCKVSRCRTHQSTREQISSQTLGGQDKAQRNSRRSSKAPQMAKNSASEAMQLHAVQDFAWHFPVTDIHACIVFDSLHVFYSNGLVSRILDYSKQIIRMKSQAVPALHPLQSTKSTNKLSIADINTIIDSRISSAPSFPSFIRIKKPFSTVEQKTGNEWKSLSKILCVTLAPILTPVDSMAMRFVRAFSDFLAVSRYRAHDDETLRYLDNYLYIMNSCKHSFADMIRQINPEGRKSLNFPKWHAMTHVCESIRSFGTLDGTDTSTGEVLHKVWIKSLISNTNFRDDMLQQLTQRMHLKLWQITHQDKKRFGLESRCSADSNDLQDPSADNLEIPSFTATVTGRSTSLPDALLTDGRSRIPGSVQKFLTTRPRRDIDQLCLPADLIDWLNIPRLEKLLQSFAVSQRQKWLDNHQTAGHLDGTFRMEFEPDEIQCSGNILVELHTGLKFWERDHASEDPDAQEQNWARCKWDWQGDKGVWKRDYVFAQESHCTPDQHQEGRLNGRVPTQLFLVFTLYDVGLAKSWLPIGGTSVDRKRNSLPAYVGALVKEFRPYQGAKFHDVHGLAEFKAMSGTDTAPYRIYPIDALGPNIHLFGHKEGRFYFNPYINMDSLNTLFDVEYHQHGVANIERLTKSSGKRKAVDRREVANRVSDSDSDSDSDHDLAGSNGLCGKKRRIG